ncbi:MAG: hypothetical protein INF48_14970, partial [Rhodobacter sp.]|nr:hypothetical protein [Rhodobacter sp.]
MLTLNQTAVSDLAPLAALTALQRLDLDQTAVSDLAPLAALTALQRLDLDQTAVSDLAPLAALTALRWLSLTRTAVSDLAPLAALPALQMLSLGHTAVSDLAPLAGLAGLQDLGLDGCQVADLRPIRGLAKLGTNRPPGLSFQDTHATRADGTLARLAGIEETEDRARETLAYLNTLPPWPEPLPWVPPETLPDIAPLAPAPDPVPRIDVGAQGLDLALSLVGEADLADPIKPRLYAMLRDAVAKLLRFGNRYSEVAEPAKKLADLTAVPFADADLLAIHLQLAVLTDVRAADADRPKDEQLDPDCRLALDAVLRIGPGVTMDNADVHALEARLAAYAGTRQPPTVAEGERRVIGAVSDSADLATERLRDAAGQAAKAGEEGRLAGYRRSFNRNIIIALGTVVSGIFGAAEGFVYGEIVLAAAQFLVLHRDAIMATAPAWGQTGYAWLEYILVRAEMILRDARSGNVDKK